MVSQDRRHGKRCAPETETARILLEDPGRSTSKSVALKAFADQKHREGPRGGVHMAYTWPWPPFRVPLRSALLESIECGHRIVNLKGCFIRGWAASTDPLYR